MSGNYGIEPRIPSLQTPVITRSPKCGNNFRARSPVHRMSSGGVPPRAYHADGATESASGRANRRALRGRPVAGEFDGKSRLGRGIQVASRRWRGPATGSCVHRVSARSGYGCCRCGHIADQHPVKEKADASDSGQLAGPFSRVVTVTATISRSYNHSPHAHVLAT